MSIVSLQSRSTRRYPMTAGSQAEIDGLKKIGHIVGLTLNVMIKSVKPGMTTKELDLIGQSFLQSKGARSAPILVYHFPGTTCISINEEAAHGIPGSRIIHPTTWDSMGCFFID